MITIVDDTLAEGNESFNVSLINPVGGGSILGTPSSAFVVITDNGTVKTTYIRQFTYNSRYIAGRIVALREIYVEYYSL